MAIYPTLFVDYLGRLYPGLAEGWHRYAIAGGLVLFCVLWNMLGAKAVGESSMFVGALLISPFALITIFALVRHAAPAAAVSTKGDVLTALLVAMWNYMGWDNAATVANEVDNPQRNYPRVMLLALGAIMLSYIVPIAAMWHLGIPLEAFSNGGWASIAGTVVAPQLVTVLVVTGMLTEFSSFNALVMSYSHLPVAMAEDGHLPRIFTRKLKSGAPWVAIVVLGTAWGLSLGLKFDRLIMLDILIYGASLVLEFLALIMLRIKEPDLPRPFRVPGGMAGAILVGVGPTALLIFASVRNRSEQLELGRLGSISSLYFGLGLMALGVVYYFVAGRVSKVSSEARDPY
jgi:amino acid transporter